MKRVPENLTTNARTLRTNATEAERKLWQILARYRPRFTRQLPIGRYIADIACRQAKLIVELDGSQHQDAATYDQARTHFLEEQGWQVLRFWNNEVTANPEGVTELILNTVAHRQGGTHPQPLPSREGRNRRTARSIPD